MYSVGPASVVLVEKSGNGMTMRAGKDLRDLVSDLMLNSGDDFAYWAEKEATKHAQVWRDAAAQDAVMKRTGKHPDDCECDPCIEKYDRENDDDYMPGGFC